MSRCRRGPSIRATGGPGAQIAGSAAVTPGPAKVNVLVVDDSAESGSPSARSSRSLDQNVVERAVGTRGAPGAR